MGWVNMSGGIKKCARIKKYANTMNKQRAWRRRQGMEEETLIEMGWVSVSGGRNTVLVSLSRVLTVLRYTGKHCVQTEGMEQEARERIGWVKGCVFGHHGGNAFKEVQAILPVLWLEHCRVEQALPTAFASAAFCFTE
eukprot:scaffold92613_cov21-Tisochrysis_lutea.AAC.3